jgi:hypothetical protein
MSGAFRTTESAMLDVPPPSSGEEDLLELPRPEPAMVPAPKPARVQTLPDSAHHTPSRVTISEVTDVQKVAPPRFEGAEATWPGATPEFDMELPAPPSGPTVVEDEESLVARHSSVPPASEEIVADGDVQITVVGPRVPPPAAAPVIHEPSIIAEGGIDDPSIPSVRSLAKGSMPRPQPGMPPRIENFGPSPWAYGNGAPPPNAPEAEVLRHDAPHPMGAPVGGLPQGAPLFLETGPATLEGRAQRFGRTTMTSIRRKRGRVLMASIALAAVVVVAVVSFTIVRYRSEGGPEVWSRLTSPSSAPAASGGTNTTSAGVPASHAPPRDTPAPAASSTTNPGSAPSAASSTSATSTTAPASSAPSSSAPHAAPDHEGAPAPNARPRPRGAYDPLGI